MNKFLSRCGSQPSFVAKGRREGKKDYYPKRASRPSIWARNRKGPQEKRGQPTPIITASTWVDPIHGNQHSWDIPIFCKKQNRPLVLKIWRKKVLKELQ